MAEDKLPREPFLSLSELRDVYCVSFQPVGSPWSRSLFMDEQTHIPMVVRPKRLQPGEVRGATYEQ